MKYLTAQKQNRINLSKYVKSAKCNVLEVTYVILQGSNMRRGEYAAAPVAGGAGAASAAAGTGLASRACCASRASHAGGGYDSERRFAGDVVVEGRPRCLLGTSLTSTHLSLYY